MPFLGTTPTQGFVSSVDKQSITNANGVLTDFTLTHPVANANDLEVFVGNVRQELTLVKHILHPVLLFSCRKIQRIWYKFLCNF